ncbi:MAG: carbohydrate kinase [Opitutaceae bacterium]|nr:carbohydrate kinase [Opitutaceae bacterium]
MHPLQPIVLCFGEILWDFLPDGLFPGGAPLNVAYHLKNLGADVRLVSAVGRDLLGDELLRRLRHWHLDTAGISRHQGLPTGYVRVSLPSKGDAQFEIIPSVAWDQIGTNEDVIRAAHSARAFVFGSLAQRSTMNRATLERLLAVLPPDAERVCDVNLRPPHDDLPLAHELARKATLLKLNAAEAARLAASESASPGREEAHARALAEQTGCATICITAGARGAGLLSRGQWTWEPAQPVTVVDPVGAGDAFLAAFIALRLDGRPPAECLAGACRLGEWVASRRGATPVHHTAKAH